MRNRVALLAVVLSLSGCEQRAAPAERNDVPARPAAAATLGDLSTSLAAARTAFNAQRGHARFLTLLSPT